MQRIATILTTRDQRTQFLLDVQDDGSDQAALDQRFQAALQQEVSALQNGKS